MEAVVRRRRFGETGREWKIVDTDTGQIVGESDHERNAHISAQVRNARWRAKQHQRAQATLPDREEGS
jgi:hypothetical protein